ncbi:TPA: transcriptional regulator [Candidatus Gastranaerophilales bacterium HUM_2]|jgi:transcriptional regulator with XRE-family HTH domain|nr:MAG TPA: transcriptional regulator [Candidatus Gastranaerophilales bacterium HUM_2]
MSNQKELLGKRIKELRKQKGYTQDYLAEKLKIEPRQLSKLETGKHYPSFETIIALLETFDITFEELISFEHLNSANDIRKTLLKDIENIDDSKIQNVYKILRVLIN